METWKPVKKNGFCDIYQVSNTGKVRSTDRVDCSGRNRKGIELKQATVKGYKMVLLWCNSHKWFVRVHHLVAMSFLNTQYGKTGNGINDWHVNHIDGDKTNNNYENLEWLTHKEHQKHTESLGVRPKGEKQHLAVLNESIVKDIRLFKSQGKTIKFAADYFGIHHATASGVWHGRTWKHVI